MVQSVYHLFRETSHRQKDQIAVQFREQKTWKTAAWQELESQVHEIAAGLIALGIQPKHKVAILSKTRLEWTLADLAILAAGAVTVPIYHSNLAKDVAYVMNDADVELIFVDDREQLEKVRSILPALPMLKTIVCFDNGAILNPSHEIYFSSLKNQDPKWRHEIDQRAQNFKNEDLASIVYTSGTTGEPKGALITHDNLLYEADAIEKLGLLGPHDVQLLFLPLAHVFARIMQMTWIKTGHVLAYAESIEKTVANMKEVRPTLMAAVPRIYEKLYGKINTTASSSGFVKRSLAKWAFTQTTLAIKCEKAGNAPSGLSWFFAKKLVLNQIRDRLAKQFGGRLRFFISGGAPLLEDIAYFFKYTGVTILEGYGLTETSATVCVNVSEDFQIGTVGKPLPGTYIKIASDGEILVKGRSVFKGYNKLPDETKACFDAEGWFQTGDIGIVDSDGFLRITDRKKDIIVTTNGKKIAPQKIEALIKEGNSLISNIMVYGDGRPYLVALITIEGEPPKDIQKILENRITLVNRKLPRFEQIKKFALLDHDFTVGDQLTPTLKIRRAVCKSRYKKNLDALYA